VAIGALDLAHRHRDQLRAREAPLADGTDVPNPTRSAPHSAMDLDRAISALPDGYREVLVLHDVEGYTHQEIAALLDLAVGTSKSQLFHARRSMRAAMKEIRDGRTRS
jgi:RNA polymerase sigma-70 factor (ECF subfamily)